MALLGAAQDAVTHLFRAEVLLLPLPFVFALLPWGGALRRRCLIGLLLLLVLLTAVLTVPTQQLPEEPLCREVAKRDAHAEPL